MTYATEIQAAIVEDGNRISWTVAQWRAYFLEEVTDIPKTGVFATEDMLRTFGATRGAEILNTIETNNKHVFRLMENGGVDLTIPGVIGVLRAPLTSEERDNLRSQQTAPRHVHLDLPDPRERLMKQALEEIA